MISPNKKQIKNSRKKREFKMRYSFLTFVLLACLAHVGISAFYNISKTINYQGKIRKMDQLKNQAVQDNLRLKEELDNFNSLESLEAIARNNLKMAGEDEVLVIINKKIEPKTTPEVLPQAVQTKKVPVKKYLEKKQ